MNELPDLPTGEEISLAVCLEKYGLRVDEKQNLIPALELPRYLIFLIENSIVSHNLSTSLVGLI